MGTILSTLGQQLGVPVLDEIGTYAKGAAGPAMAVSIGFALHAPSLVLFSLVAVGVAANSLGGAGGPAGRAGGRHRGLPSWASSCPSETKVDILVTPFVTILWAVAAWPCWCGACHRRGEPRGWATLIMCRHRAPSRFFMGIGGLGRWWASHLRCPSRSAAICAALSLTGLAGGAAVAGCCAQMVGFAVHELQGEPLGRPGVPGAGHLHAADGQHREATPASGFRPILTSLITGPIATCVFHLQMNGAAISSGMGTCGLVGPIGVYTGWLNDVASGAMASITAFDWLGLAFVCFVLPAVLTWAFGLALRKAGWIREGDLRLAAVEEAVEAASDGRAAGRVATGGVQAA